MHITLDIVNNDFSEKWIAFSGMVSWVSVFAGAKN